MCAKLFTKYIPTMTLHVDDRSWSGHRVYPCAAVDYDIAMNSIPRASVYVSLGNYLNKSDAKSDIGTTSCRPQKLLSWMQHRSATRAGGLFVACHIMWGDTLVFKGYIVSGSYQYTTKGQSSMMIVFDCMWSAAALMIQPVSSYSMVAVGSMINVLEGKTTPGSPEAEQAGVNYTQTVDVCGLIKDRIRGTSIQQRLAYCVGSILAYTAYDEYKAAEFIPRMNPACLAAFGGNIKLKGMESGVSPTCDPAFTENLWKGLYSGVQQSDMFTAILRTLTSTDFGLELAPRISCDSHNDCKLKIQSAATWLDPRTGVTRIPMDYISQVRSVHNVFERLNEPEVLIVNGASQHGLAVQDGDQGIAGMYGICAKDPVLSAELQRTIGSTNIQSLLNRTQYLRCKMIQSPKWIDLVGVSPSSDAIDFRQQDNRLDPSVVRQPSANEPINEQAMGVANMMAQLDRGMNNDSNAFYLFNRIAELLFAMYFRASDKAVVECTPDLAFGMSDIKLENLLGTNVEIKLGAAMYDTDVTLRGCLQGINIRYSAATKSSMTYNLTLNRVRLMEEDGSVMYSMVSPIYTY